MLNAGVSSFGTARATLLLRRLDTSRARAVVVQYFLNDYREKRAFVDAGGQLQITPRAEFEPRPVRGAGVAAGQAKIAVALEQALGEAGLP